MPFPNFNTFCFGISTAPGDKCIAMPGGVELCVSIPSMVPLTGAEIVQDLFAKLNTALAPLQPVFNIIDAVLAIFDCIKAIATLNPVKIIECIPNLADRINKLLLLIPQLSLPALIKGFLDCLILYLESLLANIERAREYLDRILAAELAGANTDINLGPIIDCATGDLDELFIFMGEQATPINRIIGIINTFLKLLGAPCIPLIGAPNLDPGFTILVEKLIEFLEFLSQLLTIPIPIPQLTTSADDC